MKHLFSLLGIAALTACQMMPSGFHSKQARATLEPRSGSSASGHVDFREKGDKLLVTANLADLKPNSEHGFHIHDKGDCSAADATSAGGHFNPEGRAHGDYRQATHHAGDMPNLRANEKGEVSASFELGGVHLDDGKQGILNRAVVVHADPDDYRSQPAGNSGGRIACGVIKQR